MLELGLYGQEDYVEFDSMSELLFSYYAERNSTVIVKTGGRELTDKGFEEAAGLSALACRLSFVLYWACGRRDVQPWETGRKNGKPYPKKKRPAD